MMLVHLLNAPLYLRRGAAIAVCFVFLSVACSIVSGFYSLVMSARDEVYDKREELGRLLSLVTLEESVRSRQPAQSANAEFLLGENEAAARSGLQKRLSEAASNSQVMVLSAGNAPTLNEHGVVYVGLRANISGSLEGVHGLILNLETTLPVLFIREAVLTATRMNTQPAQNGSIEISAQLLFYGVLQANTSKGALESRT